MSYQKITNTVSILKKLKTNGATVYTFSPSMNDMLLMFGSNKNIQFNFSKFVCLNLPEWGDINKQRLYKLPTDLESLNDTSVGDDANTFVPKAIIQNYVENFCSYMDVYRDDNNFSNTAEIALWKSLLNVSRSGTNVNTQTIQLIKDDEKSTSNKNVYKEVDEVQNSYSNIITYVGDLNFTNHVKSNGKEYMEVFGLINSEAGKNKDVRFTKNKQINPTLALIPSELAPEWISGNEKNYNNAVSSSKTYTKAIYDTDNKKYTVSSDMDMLNIDWESLEGTISENYSKGDFEFNAVLLYYDIWDETNKVNSIKRNLFGIMFLDSFEKISSVTEKITPFKKYQHSDDKTGNSYGFRINFMLSNSTNNITSNIILNDYSTISMELYMKALEKLNVVSDLYLDSQKQIHELNKKYTEMQQLLLGVLNK